MKQVWQTEDGKLFDSEEEAEFHERGEKLYSYEDIIKEPGVYANCEFPDKPCLIVIKNKWSDEQISNLVLINFFGSEGIRLHDGSYNEPLYKFIKLPNHKLKVVNETL